MLKLIDHEGKPFSLTPLMEEAQNAEYRSTRRCLTPADITAFVELLPKAKKRVRVYSSYGFVPMKYKWPCAIEYIEARRIDENTFMVINSIGGAQRSHGSANLRVVQ